MKRILKSLKVIVLVVAMVFVLAPTNVNARVVAPMPFDNFNHIRCVECRHKEQVGLLLAYRIAKACYVSKGLESQLMFNGIVVLEIIEKAIKTSTNTPIETLYDFFFSDDKSNVREEERSGILYWLNEHYKCSNCGSGNWKYEFVSGMW